MLIQVGVMALRSPSGEFLPSVPIMREIEDGTQTDEITQNELEKLFVDRMKKYANAGKKSHSQRARNCNT